MAGYNREAARAIQNPELRRMMENGLTGDGREQFALADELARMLQERAPAGPVAAVTPSPVPQPPGAG